MSDYDDFLQEQLQRPGVAQEFYRLKPFYDLAGQLLLLRKQRGLSQQELAEKANTTQAVVSRLENVAVHCSLESVIRLADALGAVLEVNLTPLEEMNAAGSTDEGEEENCEEPEGAIRQGKVFFGKTKSIPCATTGLFWFDPSTQQVDSSRKHIKRKTVEIA